MSATLIPDTQAIVTKYLNDHPDVQALEARVASRLPDNDTFTRPVVKLTQLDAADDPTSRVEHLVSFLLQFDCYAGGGDANTAQRASLLSRTIRAVLKSMQGQTLDGAVVTQVTFTSHARIPDEAFTPWRERYVLDAEVRVHG